MRIEKSERIAVMLSRVLKFLHELGAVGFAGALSSCFVLIALSPVQSAPGFLGMHLAIAALMHWLVMPSLVLVLISGLLAIAANRAFANASWAWVKALLGLGVFEGALLMSGSTTRLAAQLSSTDSSAEALDLSGIIHSEKGTLCLLLGLTVINVVLAIWRPRLGKWKIR